MAQSLEFILEAFDEDYDVNDERWIEQVDDLHRELEVEVGTLTHRKVAKPGHKSGLVEVIIALGSAGAIEAAVQCFLGWLKLSRKRRIVLRVEIDGKERVLEFESEGMDAATFNQHVQNLLTAQQTKRA